MPPQTVPASDLASDLASGPATDPAAAPIHAEYAALAARSDAFFAGVLARHRSVMHCQSGCAGCCQDGLSVSPLEAAAIRKYLDGLPAAERQRIASRARAQGTTHTEHRGDPDERRCVFLDGAERCAIYPARPLVCRTQGLPLAYSADVVPAEALRFRARDGRAVVVCPLNFSAAPTDDPDAPPAPAAYAPGAADILDAERIDRILALLNHRFVTATTDHIEPATEDADAVLTRTSLHDLALGLR